MAKRLSFPEEEERFSWLVSLLDGYQLLDKGVQEGVSREQKKGRQLACGEGCAACCRAHKDIPVYPLELVGISWYVSEMVKGEHRKALKARLQDYSEGDSCPFLVDEACSIHPMRPFACRQFNVFGAVCEEGEDAYHTRPGDVMKPLKDYTDKAFKATLPFYGFTGKEEKNNAIKEGALHKIVKTLQSCNWKSLGEKMGD